MTQPVAAVAEIPAPIPVKDVEAIASPVAPVVVPTPAPVVDIPPKTDIEIKVFKPPPPPFFFSFIFYL